MTRLHDLHEELRRRKVYRVAIAYAAVAFAVWQIADIAFPSLGLPDAAVTFVLVLTLLCFPVALILAWAYELTPDQSPGAQGASAPTSDRTRVKRNPTPSSTSRSEPPSGNAIAVLPFDNMSGEEASEYFAHGISEELTHSLGRMADLRVAARTSAFAFEGQRMDVREIGQRLGVAHVVEGSVRRAGNRVRITAQLIDTRDGFHVWSERFDREMDDVFAIQDQIVEAVVERVLNRLGQTVDTPPPLPRTDHMEAYDLYLRARHELRAFAGSHLDNALELLDRAVELDPSFAPAHAARAEALTTEALGFSRGTQEDLLVRARDAAERAIASDADLPEAHVARALALLYHDWSFREARGELERAQALNPSLADAHRWAEFYWTYVEQDYERARASLDAARALDPLDGRILLREGTVEYLLGDRARAETIFRTVLASEPGADVAAIGLMDTLVREGRFEEAAECASTMPMGPHTPDAILGVPGLTLALAGRPEAARARLDILEKRRREGYSLPFWRAVIHAALGELDAGFRLLDEAVEEKDGGLLFLSVTPTIPGFQQDPRFSGVLRRIGLGHLAPSIA